MNRRVLAVAIVVAFLAALIFYSQYRRQAPRVSGFVEADEIRVGSRIGGRVQAVHVEEGQRVERGEVLVELEPFDLLEKENEARQTLAARDADYRRLLEGPRPQEIAQAKARYEQNKARLDLLEAGPRAQEIGAARSRLRAAEAELQLAKAKYERRAELFEQKAVSREEFDLATEELDAARAMLNVRQEELELLEIGTREEELREARAKVEEVYQQWQLMLAGYREEDIEQAKAARDAAAAALDVIRQQKTELKIVCPTDGVVEALELQRGDLAPAGGPVLSIMDDRRMWVRAYVPQNRVGLRVGDRLWVTVDSFGDQRFLGEVSFISRQAEFTPSNVQTPEERAKQVFRVKVQLQEGLDKLRPGMTADVWLDPIEASP